MASSSSSSESFSEAPGDWFVLAFFYRTEHTDGVGVVVAWLFLIGWSSKNNNYNRAKTLGNHKKSLISKYFYKSEQLDCKCSTRFWPLSRNKIK